MRRRVDCYDWIKALVLLGVCWESGDAEAYGRMRDFVATLGTPA